MSEEGVWGQGTERINKTFEKEVILLPGALQGVKGWGRHPLQGSAFGRVVGWSVPRYGAGHGGWPAKDGKGGEERGRGTGVFTSP